jgi:chloramphenicol-sensitive protein RarD
VTSARPSARRGLLLGIGAYAMWGLFPLYWPHLEPASATEILANRMLWSLVFVAVVLTLRRRWAPVAALRAEPRRLALLFAAAVLVAVNWGVYIWGVNSGKVVETSLGYFVNPLITVLLGVVVLRERLRLLPTPAPIRRSVPALTSRRDCVSRQSVSWWRSGRRARPPRSRP